VVVVLVWLVAMFLMITAAPDTIAPCGSVTVPLKVPVGPACADAKTGKHKNVSRNKNVFWNIFINLAFSYGA
jgi:hypothetical protein